MPRLSSVDLTVTVCSVCRGTTFRRYGYHADPDDPIATEFADCLCGTRYLYKRPIVPGSASSREAAAAAGAESTATPIIATTRPASSQLELFPATGDHR